MIGMSVTRSPRHNSIRQSEELADRRKVVNVICAFVALACFAVVVGVIVMGRGCTTC